MTEEKMIPVSVIDAKIAKYEEQLKEQVMWSTAYHVIHAKIGLLEEIKKQAQDTVEPKK